MVSTYDPGDKNIGHGMVISTQNMIKAPTALPCSTNVVILANLPTSDPNNIGQVWNDSGTLKISAG